MKRVFKTKILSGKNMNEEYIKKLKTMKPSEFIEEIFGIKLLSYQKIMIDTMDTKPKYLMLNPHRNCVDFRCIKFLLDTLYQDKVNEKLSGVNICQEH